MTLDEVFALARAALLRAGSSDEMARIVADTVMRAERDGCASHGLFRIPGYVASLNSGKVNPNANPTVEQLTPVLIRCDADNGYAPLAHARSLGPLIRAAREYGIAMLSIVRSHHFAALWPEIEALTDHELVALSCVNYMPMVAPHGATEKLFGSNPVAFGWPRPGQTPVVFDMATAAMAMGEIQIAARDKHAVPPGTGLSKDGKVTTDPREILAGMLLPFGGHKGSHIAMMVELLAGPLVGESVSFETGKRDNGDGGPPAGGQFILAMDPKMSSNSEDWSRTANDFFDRLNSNPDVRLPGARRYRNRLDTGPRLVNKKLVEKVRSLAACRA